MSDWYNTLTAHGLRERFQRFNEIEWSPEPREEVYFTEREPAEAAVLVPMVIRESGLHVLLTQRTAHLNDHAGQISFPGGRCEPEDGHPIETALRETEEETGLLRQHVEVLGTLPIYRTATNFLVTPVVALVQPHFELKPDAFEVEEVFEVPLAFLMNPANHQRQTLETPKGPRSYFAMPYRMEESLKTYYIWGATATMLRNVYHFLAADR